MIFFSNTIRLRSQLSILFILFIACVQFSHAQPQKQMNVPQKIITTDWSIAETLLAIDAPLIGVGDALAYQNWVKAPQLPDHVIDLGLRSQPNLEALFQVNANTLINSTWFLNILPPKLVKDRYHLYAIDFYGEAGFSWQNTVRQTQRLGEITHREKEANALIALVHAQMEKNSHQLSAYRNQPFAIVQFIDARHLRIYGNNSLYGAVLERLNLKNAWQQPTNAWGFQSIALAQLSQLPPKTQLIIVEPIPIGIFKQLNKSQLWQALPFSKAENHHFLEAVWAFGGLPSMQRFSTLLTEQLQQLSNGEAHGDQN